MDVRCLHDNLIKKQYLKKTEKGNVGSWKLRKHSGGRAGNREPIDPSLGGREAAATWRWAVLVSAAGLGLTPSTVTAQGWRREQSQVQNPPLTTRFTLPAPAALRICCFSSAPITSHQRPDAFVPGLSPLTACEHPLPRGSQSVVSRWQQCKFRPHLRPAEQSMF